MLRKTIPAMAPKKVTLKATTSIDDAAKAALLAEKKGKATLVDDIPHEALEDEAVNIKRHHQENPPTQRAPFAHTALRDYLGHLRQVSPPRG
jgi:hypothetical protein